MASEGFFGFIFGAIRDSIEKCRRRSRIRGVERENANGKNVVEYSPSPIEAFIPTSGSENVVVSGENDEIRSRILSSVAYNSCNAGRPVLILHSGNFALTEQLARTFGSDARYRSISRENPIYNPFYGRECEEISQFVVRAANSGSSIDHSGTRFIDVITSYLSAIGSPLTVESYLLCLRREEYLHLDERLRYGDITEEDYRRLRNALEETRHARGSVEFFFNHIQTYAASVLATGTGESVSIKSAIEAGGVVSFDLTSAANVNLVNIVAQEISELLARGAVFTIMMESLPLNASEKLKEILYSFSGRCNYVYSADDVYSNTLGTESTFDAVLGRADAVFVTRHSSGESCRRFSQFFGNYYEQVITRSVGTGMNRPYNRFFRDRGYNDADIIHPENKPRVEENTINAMPGNIVYARLPERSEISVITVTPGETGESYPMPSARRSRLPSAGRNVNWLLFFALLILFFPAAFVYLLIRGNRIEKFFGASSLILMLLLIILSQG